MGEVEGASSIQLPVSMKATGNTHFQSIQVFPDTGANICLMGPVQLRQLKLKPSDLTSCTNEIAVAGGTSITAKGWINVNIVLGKRSSLAKVYFSKRVSRFFLSRQCCRDLQIIPETFPYPKAMEHVSHIASVVEKTRNIPEKPFTIPFEPVEGNIPALRKFLVNSFLS